MRRRKDQYGTLQDPQSFFMTFSFNVFGTLEKNQVGCKLRNVGEREDRSYGFDETGVISIGSLFLCRRESSAIKDSRNNSFHGRMDRSYFSSSSFSIFSNASSGNSPIQSISPAYNFQRRRQEAARQRLTGTWYCLYF
jgi:hypothetical protein